MGKSTVCGFLSSLSLSVPDLPELCLNLLLNQLLAYDVDKREIEEVGCARMALCKCEQSKNYPMCDGSHETFNRQTGSSISPLIVEVSDKPTNSTRKARRRSTLSTSKTDLNTAGLTDLSETETRIVEPATEVKAATPDITMTQSPRKQEVLPQKVDKRKIKAVFTAEDVAKHNTEDDCWMIIKGHVYDISAYFPYHPGGKRALLKFAGRDGTENVEFHSSRMMYLLDNYFYIGRLDTTPEGANCVIS
jgi:cytochrome b involved in lipid metabolism